MVLVQTSSSSINQLPQHCEKGKNNKFTPFNPPNPIPIQDPILNTGKLATSSGNPVVVLLVTP
jgi:hypothetical protein